MIEIKKDPNRKPNKNLTTIVWLIGIFALSAIKAFFPHSLTWENIFWIGLITYFLAVA